MSKEQACEFIRKAKSDKALQEKIDNLPTDDLSARRAQFMALAAAAGYSFTGDDLDEIQGMKYPENCELCDEDLEQVAGGAKFCPVKEYGELGF